MSTGMRHAEEPHEPSSGAAPQERLDELKRENARLWAENNRLRAERRELEYYERLAEGMRGSVSWKITAPLRAGKVLAAKARYKLDERRG